MTATARPRVRGSHRTSRHRVHRRLFAFAERKLRDVAHDLRPHSWSIAVAAMCGTVPVLYIGNPRIRDTFVAVAVAIWVFRHPIPRLREMWNGRRGRWKFDWCDDLFERCGINPAPEICLDQHGRPMFWDHPGSRTIELVCPTTRGAITASKLADAGALIKSRIGGNCGHVKLIEGVGSSVTMIVSWAVAEPVEPPVAAPVDQVLPEAMIVEMPDGNRWRCTTAGSLTAALADRVSRLGYDDGYSAVPESALTRPDEPAPNRSAEPLSRRSAERSSEPESAAHGASRAAPGEGGGSTPPPEPEIEAPTASRGTGRPSDAVEGSGTLRAWQLLADGSSWSRNRLAFASGLAANTVSTKLSVWKRSGLVEQTADGWRALVDDGPNPGEDDDSQVTA